MARQLGFPQFGHYHRSRVPAGLNSGVRKIVSDEEIERVARLLRAATEGDVEDALKEAYVRLPLMDRAAALEFFNRMIDVMLGEGAGTDP